MIKAFQILDDEADLLLDPKFNIDESELLKAWAYLKEGKEHNQHIANKVFYIQFHDGIFTEEIDQLRTPIINQRIINLLKKLG